MVITINQIIAFCLVGVLIAFIVVLGMMAGPAIELLKKTKTLAETGNAAVTETKSKLEEIENKVLEAAKAVIRDTSPVIKVIACVGIGLTLRSE
jgi:ABC-type lipoprotein release transport system permease subunit